MNKSAQTVEDSAVAAQALRLELERCQRELRECQKRMEQLQQGEALLAGENRLLGMVASGRSLADILSALCRIIEELSEGALCGVLLVDRASNRVGHVTGPSLPAEYNEAIRGLIIAPEAGPCGLAVCGQEQVINADVGSDTRWAGGWRALALSHGLRACWSTPIFSSAGDVLGTFAIYWREPRRPSEQDQKIIRQTTHLASVAIERQRTEEELRRSDAFLAEAQRLSRTGSFGWNVATGEIIWSKETYCILGYDPGVKPTLELVLNRVPPEERALVQQAFDRATRERKDLDIGHRLVMADGQVKHVRVLAQPVHPGNEGLEFVGAVMDVTEMKKAENAVRAAMARFEGILEIADDAIISVDSSQRIVLFNQGAEKIFGYGSTEVLGQSLDMLLPQRFAAAHHGHIEDFSKSRDVSRTMGQRSEVFGRRKDGNEFPAEASISKLDLGGELMFTVILRDITERKRAEENLRQSEADLHEAQRLTHVGSWSHDLSSGKITASPEVHRMYQIQPQEDPSDPELYRSRVHPEDRERVQELFDRAAREKTACEADLRIVLPDRTIRHHHSTGRIILNHAGDAMKVVGIVMDVTEQKKAQAALRASEHLARGQVQALTSTLAALARESDPDRLLEHVLRTIVEQTRAHSIAAWNKNEDGARFDLIAVIENGRYQTPEETVDPAGRISILLQHHPVWCELVRTGQHGVMDNLDQKSARMCVGSGVWQRVAGDMNPDPALAILLNHLRKMGVRSVLFVPLLIAGDVAGTLEVRVQEKRNFRREEIELTQALAHQAMLALQLMRLSQQSRQAAVIAERNRMARDIHDTLAQGFTGVIMQLEAATGAATKGDLPEARIRIERASELARSSLGEARRSVRALRPQTLRNGKLFVALDGLLKSMTEGTTLNAEFHAEGDERSIPADFEEGLLRVTQEALTNAVKHADARNFSATLSVDANKIQLRLADDGRGFDPQQEHEGFGLIGMKERVDRMGGEFIIRAKPNVGTEILVELKTQPGSKSEFENEQS